MFVKGNIVYSEAGKLLVSDNFVGYQAPVEKMDELHEEDVILDDMHFSGNRRNIVYSNGRLKQKYGDLLTRDNWKTTIIKSRYSYDDQIAIMLNKDNSEEATMLYNKMQEWRSWAGRVADKIAELKSN